MPQPGQYVYFRVKVETVKKDDDGVTIIAGFIDKQNSPAGHYALQIPQPYVGWCCQNSRGIKNYNHRTAQVGDIIMYRGLYCKMGRVHAMVELSNKTGKRHTFITVPPKVLFLTPNELTV